MLQTYLGGVAHRAMWGYGVDPPSLWNPCTCLVRATALLAGRPGAKQRRTVDRATPGPEVHPPDAPAAHRGVLHQAGSGQALSYRQPGAA
jgi:hypothetical protein